MLCLHVSRCCSQIYDNGRNTLGKQGADRGVLKLNKVVIHLTLQSMTQPSHLWDPLFGLLQWLHTLFGSLVQCWDFLTTHIKNLTIKALPSTRWEGRLLEMPEMVKALTAMKEFALRKMDAQCCHKRCDSHMRQRVLSIAVNGRCIFIYLCLVK